MSYRFEIATEPKTGADLASCVEHAFGMTCGEHKARSLKSCAARKLARVLIAAGMPDGPIEAWRGTVPCYTARSLAAYARTTLEQDPRFRVIPHRENPYATREPSRVLEETP
jgi:hypothetical protein